MLEINLKEKITTKNFLNQARSVYLKLYNAFLSLQTYPKLCETPGGGAL
jgi:hypothetical protein